MYGNGGGCSLNIGIWIVVGGGRFICCCCRALIDVPGIVCTIAWAKLLYFSLNLLCFKMCGVIELVIKLFSLSLYELKLACRGYTEYL